MIQITSKTTYQYVVELEDQELAKAATAEEESYIRKQFTAMRDAVYQRDWQSWNTAA